MNTRTEGLFSNRASSFLKPYKFGSIRFLKQSALAANFSLTETDKRDASLADKCQRAVSVLPPFGGVRMDWRNDESDQSSVENLKWDENDHPVARTKDAAAVVAALDRNVCTQGVQVGIGICKDIGNFTSALENLELETKNYPGYRTSDVQTDYFNSEQEETAPVFKTREKSTFQLVVHGPEILIFQGTQHSPADIAPYWKKDSRMWLWKSVRLARRLKRIKAKAIPTGVLYREDFS